jgi:hypothetical protein
MCRAVVRRCRCPPRPVRWVPRRWRARRACAVRVLRLRDRERKKLAGSRGSRKKVKTTKNDRTTDAERGPARRPVRGAARGTRTAFGSVGTARGPAGECQIYNKSLRHIYTQKSADMAHEKTENATHTPAQNPAIHWWLSLERSRGFHPTMIWKSSGPRTSAAPTPYATWKNLGTNC